MSDINKDFLALSKALKKAGEGGLRKELNKGLRLAAKPVIADVKEAFVRELPHKGGLGSFIAGKNTRIVTLTGRDPGVQIRVAKQDPRMETEGRLVHPVFGVRKQDGKRVTVVQHVKPGIVGKQLDQSAPKVAHELEQVIQDMYRQIIREVHT